MTEQSGHYTVLARRFRPQTFDEVVGQERIGQALRNAIASDRVAHAYLFTGARGVGKTSTARIFAKALNCPHVKDAVPCNECEVCRSIAAGSDVDVLEIDGASNRGIDDIRSLRANVNVKSMRSPYKVYIIDEVHMLTKEAFNALLKTLEEPPPRVKFIFCTTEPNKVPDTILSRCQRFDFGTIASDSIKGRLASIAAAEGVEVADEALDLIARRAAGSMRDSQSLFDQLLAFGGERITATDVHQLLGTASDDRLVALIDAIIERRRDTALNLLDSSLREGVQISSFSDQVLHYLRDLLVVAVGAEGVTLQSVGESHRSRLQEQAQLWGLNTITAAMQILSETKSRMQRVNYDRALMELAVIRLSLLEDLDNIGVTIEMVRSGGGTTPQRIPAPTRVTQPSTISTPATPLAPADGSPKSLETPA
ncbi:MAG: DNA polymerase III subunit gamma/tau, partial [Planctomycetaceae bacterium]|nr:DNA polymerase III subunit gamma/tau [Planctomycetaceae bacterium]